jgi:hypothetical protein
MANKMQNWLEKDDPGDTFVENNVLVDGEELSKSCWSHPGEKAFHH